MSKKLLSFKEAESFLALNVPGVEGVYSMGQTIGISIRGDGNCFWTSCCLAVLLWALCEDCSQQLQDLLARYRAIRRGSRAHDALSLDMKVCSESYRSTHEVCILVGPLGGSPSVVFSSIFPPSN